MQCMDFSVVSTTISFLSCDVCFEKKSQRLKKKKGKRFPCGDKSQEMASVSFPPASMSPKR